MSNPSMIGPSLPPHLIAARSTTSDDDDSQDAVNIGPQLPPTTSSSKASYGPSLPPGMTYGPSIPEDDTANDDDGDDDDNDDDDDDDDDDDIIGPLPPTAGEKATCDVVGKKKREIEARAQAMKNKLTKSDTQPQRESWMTELPSAEMKIGLGPRKFRSAYTELGDQSVWTDTPAEKARKATAAREREKDAIMGIKVDVKKRETAEVMSERDKDLARQVEEYNKKFRSETLSEISRKRQKEAGSDEPKEKKMFNPETDLQLPKIMSQKKRKEVLKKSAKDLQSKFTHGSQGHFL